MKTVKRYGKKEKKFIKVQCRAAIASYNKYMGGVDLLDAFLSYYQKNIQSKKWYNWLLWHFFDLVLIQGSYIKKSLKRILCVWKISNFLLLMCYCYPERFYRRKAGLAKFKLMLNSIEGVKRGPAAPIRNKAIQGGKIDHWPEYTLKKLRCKLPGCNATTQVVCTKCNVNLCFTSRWNCFKMFHINR